MSWQSRVTRVVRSVACQRCGAGNGERCVSRTGKPAADEHAPRYYAAACAGLLPLEDDAR